MWSRSELAVDGWSVVARSSSFTLQWPLDSVVCLELVLMLESHVAMTDETVYDDVDVTLFPSALLTSF